jgi:hypothetical protein
LKTEKPYIHDFQGSPYREESYNDILRRAQKEGYDSAILKNTYDSSQAQQNAKPEDIAVVSNLIKFAPNLRSLIPLKKILENILDSLAVPAAGALGLGALGASQNADASPASTFKSLKNTVKELGEAENVARIAKELPMDEASRLARAKDLGYSLDAFHGTNADISAFDPNKLGGLTGASKCEKGVLFHE